MKTLIAMALMVTSVAVMGDEVKEVKVEEPKAEVVTVPVEAIPSISSEELKRILERDRQRAQWIKERMEEGKAKEQEEKKVDPVISKVYTFNYNPMFMRNNKITATLEVGDQAVVKLTGDRRVMKWSVGKDENAVMDLLMTYHNEDGVKPRVETIDFDLDEDEAEIGNCLIELSWMARYIIYLFEDESPRHICWFADDFRVHEIAQTNATSRDGCSNGNIVENVPDIHLCMTAIEP